MGDAFDAQVARLVWGTRWRRVIRGACTGLFWGIVPGIIIAALDGTVHFSFHVLTWAMVAAGIGAVAGAALGFARAVDERALLITADRLLASHEMASTARELAAHGSEDPFADAIISDATRLLSRQPAREALEKRRPRLLPFLPVAVALLVLALLFPVDLRALLRAHQGREGDLVMLGQDLQSYGEKLLDAKGADQGRSLALSQQLTQLGKDLSDRSLQGDDAFDRINEMEGMLSREYDLRMQEALSSGGVPAQPGGSPSGSQGTGEQTGDSTQGQSAAGSQAGQGTNGSANGGSQDALKNLSDARDRLRDAERKLAQTPQPGGSRQGGSAPSPSGADSPSTGNLPDLSDGSDTADSEESAGAADSNTQPDAPGSLSEGHAPGTSPSTTKNGPQTAIQSGQQKSPTKESLPSGDGDSTRLLVRALPDPTDARRSDQTVLNQYQRQAESALAHDEIPLKLRPYVKDYFTGIGMGQPE